MTPALRKHVDDLKKRVIASETVGWAAVELTAKELYEKHMLVLLSAIELSAKRFDTIGRTEWSHGLWRLLHFQSGVADLSQPIADAHEGDHFPEGA